MIIINRLKEFREEIGMSRSELASRVGVDRTMIWRYEKNISKPSDNIKVKIAHQLNKSVGDIFFNLCVARNATNYTKVDATGTE